MIVDAIIIGAGGAGCRAAIELVEAGFRPIILSQKERKVSKTYQAQGGIQASFGDGDSPIDHFEDTMKAGNYKADPKVVRLLTQNAIPTIKWLEKTIGVEFDKEPSGKYILKKAGGLSKPRVLSCKGSAGEAIALPLWQYVDRIGVKTIENSAVTSIKKLDNCFFKLWINANGKEETITSKVIILATGGAMPDAKKTGKEGSNIMIPDGIDLASKLGAKVNSPSLMQYHPTGVIMPASLRRTRLPETMRGLGAILLNKDLNEFTNHLDTRSQVTDAIIKEVKAGNGIKTIDGYYGVWMDTPMIDKMNGKGYTHENFTKVFNSFLEAGHDITLNPVLVYPIVHYSLGGVTINENAETSISGFFAAGEVTWGVHGEDRLMGNSLLDIFVFGKIAGMSAAKYLDWLNNKTN